MIKYFKSCYTCFEWLSMTLVSTLSIGTKILETNILAWISSGPTKLFARMKHSCLCMFLIPTCSVWYISATMASIRVKYSLMWVMFYPKYSFSCCLVWGIRSPNSSSIIFSSLATSYLSLLRYSWRFLQLRVCNMTSNSWGIWMTGPALQI